MLINDIATQLGTPLEAMESYREYHEEQNAARRRDGVPEIPLPNEARVILGFLRRLGAANPGATFAEMEALFGDVCDKLAEET